MRVRNRRQRRIVESDFFPRRLVGQQGAQQLVVQLVPGLVAVERADQAMAEKIEVTDRIENLVLVVEAAAVPGAEKPLNAFETLTLAPIDRRLVVADMLTPEETDWFDGYHARVAQTLSPLVDDETRAWLAAATRPLAQS